MDDAQSRHEQRHRELEDLALACDERKLLAFATEMLPGAIEDGDSEMIAIAQLILGMAHMDEKDYHRAAWSLAMTLYHATIIGSPSLFGASATHLAQLGRDFFAAHHKIVRKVTCPAPSEKIRQAKEKVTSELLEALARVKAEVGDETDQPPDPMAN